ncbi:MAG: hypothetical protein ABI430_02005 [Candidatus Taylorbacteria bacterium]
MYLEWNKKILPDFTDASIEKLYDEGYVFTRVGRGMFTQTRSLRIHLKEFEPSSENKRILRKNESLTLEAHPIPYKDYHWSIHKLAKDFYSDKFGKNIFSANKVKELLTNSEKSNFNTVLVYHDANKNNEASGYCISLLTAKILHYSYPFYKDGKTNPSRGLGMMVKAIMYAKEKGLQYIYLGSLQRPSDSYKLQFEGMEWFDGERWRRDMEPLKEILKIAVSY